MHVDRSTTRAAFGVLLVVLSIVACGVPVAPSASVDRHRTPQRSVRTHADSADSAGTAADSAGAGAPLGPQSGSGVADGTDSTASRHGTIIWY